ncbi:MAG: transcriptional repressor NrdR [Lentisphaerae bacterium]|jgi:transcriptional repressor NrdR|nr:transcriptional repressor NrdR [Lentisphaerota bacterium]
MRCPKCMSNDDKVIETRVSREGETTRRRRQCLNCSYRFTTYETVLPVDITVVKNDGRREEFNPEKLRTGINMACWKRSVSQDAVDKIVGDITNALALLPESEVSTRQIGEMAMAALKELDEVAYVRFASVYRKFQDADAFISEVKKLSRN